MPTADNPQFSDMRIFPARYATAFLISGDVFDNIGGDALIDKISDLYLLQTEAAKKTLDFQIAGSKNGAIAVVKSAVTGANGTVTTAQTVAEGGTFGSFKVKDGARIHFVNGTTNVARGAPTTGVVVDPGGNNRATGVITFDTVPTGTTANDYLTYEGSALKAPHGLTDLINNDTGEIQGQLRSNRPYLKSIVLNASQQRLQVALLVEVHYSLRYRTDNPGNTLILSSPTQKAAYMSGPSDRFVAIQKCQPPLIGSEAETPTRRKGTSGRTQRERTSEGAPFMGDAMFWAYGNKNHKRLAETSNPGASRVTTSNGYNLNFGGHSPVTVNSKRGEFRGAYDSADCYGNPKPILMNRPKVIRKVQRLFGEEPNPIRQNQRPALELNLDV